MMMLVITYPIPARSHVIPLFICFLYLTIALPWIMRSFPCCPFAAAAGGTVYRFISLAQYNSTTNLTWADGIEKQIATNCSASIKSAILGLNANLSVSYTWGSYIKVGA
jgi:hypothetical protein